MGRSRPSRSSCGQQYWTSELGMLSHFNNHGARMGYENAEQYCQASRENMSHSSTIIGEAYDGRLGYFNTIDDRLTIVNQMEKIITYYIPDDGVDYFNRHFPMDYVNI